MNELMLNLKTQIFAIAAMIIAFFAPIGPILIIVGLSIIADTIFGLIKAYKRKQAITSRRMSSLISKLFLYQFCVIGIYVIDKYLLSSILSIFTSHQLLATKLVTLSLIFIELTSINENIQAGFKINIWQSLKKMVARAKELKDDVEQIIDKKEE